MYEPHDNHKSKLTIHTQNLKIKQHKPTTKETYQATREEVKRKRNEQRTSKAIRKQVIKLQQVRTYQ